MLSATAIHLNYNDLDNVLNQPETEHNWAAKESAIKSLGSACHSSIALNHEFLAFIKNHRKSFNESLLTERTRLSGTACDFVEKLSTSMGRDFGFHFADLFTGALLKVCARTNKVMVTRALKALNSIVNAGCLNPLSKACQAFTTNNKTLRIACINLIASCIAQYSAQELEPFLPAFEPVLKEGVSDAAPEVRDTSRKSYKIYAELFPEQSQRLTSTLPGNVLKYLLPETRPTMSQPRLTATINRAATGRFNEPSRETSTGVSRTGPGRVGPLRARTMSVADNAPPNSFKAASSSTAQYPVQSSQPYAYHTSQYQQPPLQQTSTPQSLSRNHGPASRSASFSESTESNVSNSHGAQRLSAQRTRALTGNTGSSGSMLHRAPSINIATNGGPQRVVPPAPYTPDASKSNRPGSLMNRLSKVEPVSKASRISTPSHSSHANHGAPVEREQLSASERAKAYSANLKNDMAGRRASSQPLRSGVGGRRVTPDIPGYSGYGSLSTASMSVSSSASTASTSAATSTTSVSPASSLSTSPTTTHSPAHDQLFSTFRAPPNSQLASSPPESCPSPDARHSSLPMSQQSDDFALHAPAPLSPRIMAEVSLESRPDSLNHQQQQQAPLSPRSPLHQQSSPYQHGFSESNEQVHDVLDGYVDADSDHNMSVPDHETLFGHTDDYLKVEQEISELQQLIHESRQQRSAAYEEQGKGVFMEEVEQEHMAVKAYAEEYEATLEAVSSSSASLLSNHEEK